MKHIWRWLVVTPLLTMCVCMGLVTQTVVPANAAVPPVPVVLGETLAGPGGEAGAAACAASGICLGVTTAVILGAVLYETRDSWMPVAKGVWNWAYNKVGGTSGTSGCKVTAKPSFELGKLRMDDQWVNCNTGWTGAQRTYVQWQSFTCKGANGLYSRVESQYGETGTMFQSALSANHWSAGSNGFSGTAWDTYDLCASNGGALVQFRGRFGIGNGGIGDKVFTQVLDIGEAVPDDQASQTGTVTCRLPNGSVQTISKTVVGQVSQVQVPSCQAAYPGSTPTHVKITGGWPGAEDTKADVDLPNVVQKYPGCFDANGAFLSSCRIRVWVNGQPCHVGMGICLNWQTGKADNDDDVQCKFGPYPVDIDNCAPLKNAYKNGPRTLTTTDTAGNPTDDDDPHATPIPPPTSTDPKTEAPPCLTAAGCVVPTPPLDPNDPGDTGKNCFSGAISFNPLNWVYVPVKCALQWAFVPPDGSWTAAMARIKDPLQGAMGPWNDSLSQGWTNVSTGQSGGCNGMGVSLPGFLQKAGMPATWYPFRSCSGMAATVAGYCRVLATVGLVLMAVIKTVNIVQTGLGLSTGTKVNGAAA